MDSERFRRLAEELAERDAGLPERLAEARAAGERLRQVAQAAVDAFARRARERGAEHLARLTVGPLEPDDKHVDCLQIRIWRGRWEAVCVLKAEGSTTLVGPFKRGKPEKPCLDRPLRGAEVEGSLEDLLERLIRCSAER